MAFQRSPDWNLTPLDALQIYSLKTSPAFEAALYAGLRMANHPLAKTALVPQFCRHVGVAFQVLNDLKDWQGDTDNKLVAGQDALALRPTVLLALALKDANEQQKAELKEILSEASGRSSNHKRIDRLREIFRSCDVFEKAEVLVERSREKAESLVAEIEDTQIRDLLRKLGDLREIVDGGVKQKSVAHHRLNGYGRGFVFGNRRADVVESEKVVNESLLDSANSGSHTSATAAADGDSECDP